MWNPAAGVSSVAPGRGDQAAPARRAPDGDESRALLGGRCARALVAVELQRQRKDGAGGPSV